MQTQNNAYQPKTALGKRLLALRRAYLAEGGTLLPVDKLNEETRHRRDGRRDGRDQRSK